MRTDIHAPASPLFDPEAYDLVDVFDLHPESGDHTDLSKIVETLAGQGIHQASHSHYGCGHCGQTNLRYVALLIHRAAGEWIFTGQDCLAARFDGQTRASFLRLKRDAELARAKQAKKAAWLAFCDENPAMAYASYMLNIDVSLEKQAKREFGIDGFDAVCWAGLNWGINVAQDIARKARMYGEASVKQAALIERIVGEQDAKWSAFVAKQQAKTDEPKAEALAAGRYVIEGVVVAQKTVESDYGTTFKMLVKLDGGQRVWGTEPSSISEVTKGDRVRFTAKVEPKVGEEDFGFYSRPTKAEILVKVVTTEVAA